jgi:pimeloyl-ACP methyl ester carboxylesterase
LPTLVVTGFAGPRPIVRRAFPYHRWHGRVNCGAARRRQHRKGFILGERDMMTPARAGKALVAALPNSRTVVLRGAGHMMMVERPDELFEALRG